MLDPPVRLCHPEFRHVCPNPEPMAGGLSFQGATVGHSWEHDGMRRIVLIVLIALTIGGCSSSGSDAPGSTPPSGTVDSVTPDQAKSWLTRWCDVQPGMTRDQIRDIMGAPTDEFDLASGTPQMSWYGYEFGFTAFMNSDDVARQLDVNEGQLTDAQRSELTCESTRVLE